MRRCGALLFRCALAALALALLGGGSGIVQPVGACITGRFGFFEDRVWRGAIPMQGIDTAKYDWSVDYGSVITRPDGSAELQLLKNENPAWGAIGARLTLTHPMLYGRITGRFTSIPERGVVTTMITMSPIGDEIDYEMLGKTPSEAQTVLFYRGIQEYTHGLNVTIPGDGNMATTHEYTFDWSPERIQWFIDGELKRTVIKNDSISAKTPPGERWFPSSESVVQISVWDAGSSPMEGTKEWAGGEIQWGRRTMLKARYEWVDVTCYGSVAAGGVLTPGAGGSTSGGSTSGGTTTGGTTTTGGGTGTPTTGGSTPSTGGGSGSTVTDPYAGVVVDRKDEPAYTVPPDRVSERRQKRETSGATTGAQASALVTIAVAAVAWVAQMHL